MILDWFESRIDFIDGLSDKELQYIKNISIEKQLPKKSNIFSPGEYAHSLYIIMRGRIKIYIISSGGDEIVLTIRYPGEIFGLGAICGETRRAVYATTIDESLMWVINRDDFLILLKEFPEISLRIIRILNARIKHLNVVIEDLTSRDVAGRLARLLLKLSQQCGVNDMRGILIQHKFTHQDLASMIASSRPTVSLILKIFQMEKMVHVDKKQIFIVDKDNLAKWAEI